MSNRYKCDIIVGDNDQLNWQVVGRLGSTWTGTISINDCNTARNISYTINTNPTNNSSMPRKAVSALVYKINRLVVNSIRNEVTKYIHKHKYGINQPTIG